MIKFDSFTKVLLVAIAIFLGMIALRPVFHTEMVSANLGQFDNVDFEINRNTGQVWVYNFDSGRVEGSLKLEALGQPMQTK